MKKSIGIFINRDTQDEYEVFEEIDSVTKPSSSTVKVLQFKIYTTVNGVKVKSVDDDLSSFKLSESIIHKK